LIIFNNEGGTIILVPFYCRKKKKIKIRKAKVSNQNKFYKHIITKKKKIKMLKDIHQDNRRAQD